MPRIVPDRDKYRKWYLDEDFEATLLDGTKLIIRKGYRFDAHSVPFIFRWLFPKYDADIVAALIHDYLVDTSPWHRFNRKFIDEQYTHFMQVYKASWFRTFFMPKAVRLYGFWLFDVWGDYRGETKPNSVLDVRYNI